MQNFERIGRGLNIGIPIFFICDSETFKKHTFCFIETVQQKMFSESLLEDKTQCKQPM